MLVRHLFMPGLLDQAIKVIDFVADISKGIYLNLMNQYRPCHRAGEYPELSGRVDLLEYRKAVKYMRDKGLK